MTTVPPPRPVISPVLSSCLRCVRKLAEVSPLEMAIRLSLAPAELDANEEGITPLGDVQIEEYARALKLTPFEVLTLTLLTPAPKGAKVVVGAGFGGEVRILPFVVRKTIERLGLSQVTFAAALGINQSTVNRWCSGAMPLSEEILVRIAEAFKTTTARLIVDALTYEDPALEQAKSQLRDAFTTWLRARYVAAVESKRLIPVEIAEKIGVHRAALTRFASGKTLTPAIAYALHLELDRLIPVAHLLGIATETEAAEG